MRISFVRASSVVVLLSLSPAAAWACGGLFWSTTPVDQNAERILFEVNGDGTITTAVEISYTGASESFSWVVPVADTPTLDVIPATALQTLDAASNVQIIGPPTVCDTGFDMFGRSENLAGGSPANDDGGGVQVEELPRVGPYDPLVVSGTDAQELIDWLNTNGYLITPEMQPFVEAYVAGGMKFLAMKLSAGAQVSDIAPIKMTYASTYPLIPLVLTAVAAEPEMGVIVMITGDQRYEASNWDNLLVDTAKVQSDPSTGQNNYFALVSFLIDKAGGEAFVTQYAGASSDIDPLSVFIGSDDADAARNYALEVLQRKPYLTRLYSRISAWEIGHDPVFMPSAGGDVSRVHDLMDRPAVNVCSGGIPPRIPCGDTYCGDGAECASTSEGIDGCVCPEGSVARAINDPARPSLATVHCQPASFDLMQSVEPANGGGPCATYSCGEHGACVAVNGFPTCSCDDGFAAHPDLDNNPNELRCAAVSGLYDASQLEQWRTPGCNAMGGPPGPVLALLVVLGMGAFARRRRR